MTCRRRIRTFLLPIFMVVSMLLAQRMTPQAGMDPAQQKMMTVDDAADDGLHLLPAAGRPESVLRREQRDSIAQQAVMNRTSLGREMREMMAKRARKKEK